MVLRAEDPSSRQPLMQAHGDDDELKFGLNLDVDLDPDVLEIRDSDFDDTPPRRTRRRSFSLQGVLSIFLFFVVAIATFSVKLLPTLAAKASVSDPSSGLAPISGTTSTPEAESAPATEPDITGTLRPLGIVLQPELHISRAPKTLTFSWNITTGLRSPDGVQKRVYLVNDEFPGPTIEARSGDELVIEVHNSLTEEGVSLHWHGLQLLNQSHYDGAVGFTQCPIPTDGTFTYRIKIGDDEHGTFWWHAHNQVQRGDGLFGGLVVHRPRHQDLTGSSEIVSTDDMTKYRCGGEVLLMVGDWFHASARGTLKWYTDYEHFGSEPVPDSLLVNGRGLFDCSRAVPARPVVCSKVDDLALQGVGVGLTGRARWRIVNTGSIAGINVSTTGISMTAVEVDGGGEITLQPAQGVGILYPGERVDVIAERFGASDVQQTFSVLLDSENLKYTNPSLNPNQSFAILPSDPPQSDAALVPRPLQDTIDLAAAVLPQNPPTPFPNQATHTFVLYVKTQLLSKLGNRPTAFINHTTWSPQTPPLAALPRSSWDANQLVPFVPLPTSSASPPVWVDIVINNLDDGSHPFHLHGHSFFVLSSYRAPGRSGGWGSWNPFAGGDGPPAGLNLVSPVRKDTVAVPRRGHVVIRFRGENPGIWALHCHMLVHLGSGMAMGVHVGRAGDEGHVEGLDRAALEMCGTGLDGLGS